MTIGDAKYLAIGYLLNQNMLKKNDKISKVEFDKELNIVVVELTEKLIMKINLKR